MITKHTPEIDHQIMAAIRAGGYPHVAAAAAGVDDQSFAEWLRLGERKNAREPYKGFVRRLHQATAQARLMREVAAAEDDPAFWLKNGPGRDMPGKPGWAAMIRPIIGANQQNINLFMTPDFLEFLATLRAVLAPYPDALTALSIALESPKPAKVIPNKSEEGNN